MAQGSQSVWLETINHCQPISPVWVNEVTTGALQNVQQATHKKAMALQVLAIDYCGVLICPDWFFSSSAFRWFAGCTGSSDPPAWRGLLCFLSKSQQCGRNARIQRQEGAVGAIEGHQHSSRNQYLLFSARSSTTRPLHNNLKRTAHVPCVWPNCQKQTPWGHSESLVSFSGTCANRPAPFSSPGIR